MDIKTVSSLLHDVVLNPELSSQEHSVDRTTSQAQILTGGLSLHSSWGEGLKKRPRITLKTSEKEKPEAMLRGKRSLEAVFKETLAE